MSEKDLDELKAIINSTQALISHLLISLKENSEPPSVPENDTPPNAPALASSVSTLIHAQTTKLSLLVTNKPFTPTAITKILKSLASECIPALASATQLAASPQYPKCIHDEMLADAQSILMEFQALLREIPVDERGVEQTQSRGAFSYTGVIWAACDKLKAGGDGGVHEIASRKAESFLGLVRDALEELREWRDAGEDASEDDGDSDDDDDDDSLDMIMDSKCPKAMLPIAGQVIGVIDHIRLLYPPLVKRRIKRFPAITASTKVEDLPEQEVSRRLDGLLEQLETLHDEVDQAAFVLYERGIDEAEKQLQHFAELGEACASSMSVNWQGEGDELTAWIKDKYIPKLRGLVSVSLSNPG